MLDFQDANYVGFWGTCGKWNCNFEISSVGKTLQVVLHCEPEKKISLNNTLKFLKIVASEASYINFTSEFLDVIVLLNFHM